MAENKDNKNQGQQEATQDLSEYNGKRSRLFFAVFKARLFQLVKVNLLVVIALLPALIVGILFTMVGSTIQALQPHSANIGLGLPAIFNSSTRSLSYIFTNYGIFVHVAIGATIPLAFLALSGAFFTIRQLSIGKNIGVVKTFFRGVKKCSWQFVVVSIVVGGLVFLISAGAAGFDHFLVDMPALKIVFLVLFGIIALALSFFLFFYTTISTTYKISFVDLLRNSIRYAFMPKLIWRHIIILAFSALPIILMVFLFSLPIIGIIISIVLALVGVSFIVLIWVIYGNWVFKNVGVPVVKRPVKARKLKAVEVVDGATEDNNDNAEPFAQEVTAVNVEEAEAKEVAIDLDSVEEVSGNVGVLESELEDTLKENKEPLGQTPASTENRNQWGKKRRKRNKSNEE